MPLSPGPEDPVRSDRRLAARLESGRSLPRETAVHAPVPLDGPEPSTRVPAPHHHGALHTRASPTAGRDRGGSTGVAATGSAAGAGGVAGDRAERSADVVEETEGAPVLSQKAGMPLPVAEMIVDGAHTSPTMAGKVFERAGARMSVMWHLVVDHETVGPVFSERARPARRPGRHRPGSHRVQRHRRSRRRPAGNHRTGAADERTARTAGVVGRRSHDRLTREALGGHTTDTK